jgi:hypothetical protein
VEEQIRRDGAVGADGGFGRPINQMACLLGCIDEPLHLSC